MAICKAYLDDIVFSFRKQKDMAEQAIRQVVQNEDFFRRPGEFSNSVAVIVKHLAGNLKSRWTDFLTTDGEKPSRDRDREFVITEADSRDSLMASWEAGWSALFHTLGGLTEADLLKTVTIRGEPHSAMQAIHRSLTHTAYHTGQILYLCRLMHNGEWQWITVPPGQSVTARKYRS
jgi:uncharacterized damage-inducible protein DinB